MTDTTGTGRENNAEGTRRRVVISVAFPLVRDEDGELPGLGLDPLAKAPEHARNVAEALTDFQYHPHPPVAAEDQEAAIARALVSSDTDVLIVHVIAHGQLADGSSEKLYVMDGQANRLPHPVGSWLERIEDYPDEHRPLTLIILDVCYAGEVAVTAWHARMDVTRRRAWVLAATGPNDAAFGYRLSRALVAVLDRYRRREIRIDPSVRYIPPRTVWQEIESTVNDLIKEDGGLPQKIITSLIPWHTDPSHLPFLPNPAFDPEHATARGALAGVPVEIARLADWAADPAHFIQRAAGVEPLGRDWEDGYFCGRRAILCELSAWLDAPGTGPGLRIVTGKPGAGKSALLGILVCSAHPQLRRHTRALWHGLQDMAPGQDDRLVVVHARRLGLPQMVASLVRQLEEITRPHGVDAAHRVTGEETSATAAQLVGLMPHDGPPVTIVIDALDEAERPGDIAATLILPLAQLAQQPGSRLRLLLGTREDKPFEHVLDLARATGSCTNLSTVPPDVVRADIEQYVKQLLTADGPYAPGRMRTVREALAESIAARLTGWTRDGQEEESAAPLEWGEFLAAGLFVHQLLSSSTVCETVDEAWRLGLQAPRTLPELLALDLSRRAASSLLSPVLTALAFARGQGMPERSLARAAAAFTTDGRQVNLENLYRLLDGEARFYLRRAVDDDGTTLYRLFHEGLADWLRASAATGTAARTPQQLLYERLLASVPQDTASRPLWALTSPYVMRHLADHAREAGPDHLDALFEDGVFLTWGDPQGLADAAPHTRSAEARANVSAYRASWSYHRSLPVRNRRQVLALDAARFRNTALRAQLPGDGDWQVRWATGQQVSPALVRTIVADSGEVTAIAAVQVEGRPHIVTGTSHVLGLWDLATGQRVRRAEASVRSLAIVELDGRPHAVTDKGTAWDLTTGNRFGIAHSGRSVASVELDGRAHAAFGDSDGALWVQKLHSGGAETRRRFRTGLGWIEAVAVVDVKGSLYAITGNLNGSLHVWDLTRNRHVRELVGGQGRVRAIAGALVGQSPCAVTGSESGQVLLWDLNTGHRRGARGGAHPVCDITTVTVEGHPHGVIGRADGSVELWNLADALLERPSPPRYVTRQLSRASSVASVQLDGRPHVVTGSGHGTVDVWDLTVPVDTAWHDGVGHTDRVSTVRLTRIDGRPHAVSGGYDGAVCLWELVSGRQVRRFTGHESKVYAVAVLGDGDTARVVAGRSNGYIQAWHLTGRLVGEQRRHQGPVEDGLLSNRYGYLTRGDGVVVRGSTPRDASGGSDTSQLRMVETDVTAMASADGGDFLLFATRGGELRLRYPVGHFEQRFKTGHSGVVHVVALGSGADNRRLAISVIETVAHVWDLSSGQQLHTLHGDADTISAVGIASLARIPHAVTGCHDGSVRLWDLTTGNCRSTFRFPGPVTALDVSSDGYVVVGVDHEVVTLSLAPLIARLRDVP